MYSVPVLSQPERKVLYSELHIIPSDSLNTVYFSYRIPYDRFIFVKNNDYYEAEFRVSVEVFDSSGKHVTRQIEDGRIKTNKFDETNSKYLYKQDIIKFHLNNGFYKIYPILTDLNVDKDLHLKAIELNIVKKDSSDFLNPIIVESKKSDCVDKTSMLLANFGNIIPFSDKEFNIVIPSTKPGLRSIHCTVINAGDTVFNQNLTDSFPGSIKLSNCNGQVILKTVLKEKSIKNFIIRNLSQKLKEGETKIYVSMMNPHSVSRDFAIHVTWIDKPLSLNDYENAIKNLRIIGKDSIAASMLSESSKLYPELLYKFWKNLDPTPNSQYNPVMDEFYSRVDYASKHFFTLSGKSGITTDRGKIFIRYGQPSKIERTSNQLGQVLESWIYKKPERKFVFIDKDGSGDFSIKKD